MTVKMNTIFCDMAIYILAEIYWFWGNFNASIFKEAVQSCVTLVNL
jgi:hypothetical protein